MGSIFLVPSPVSTKLGRNFRTSGSSRLGLYKDMCQLKSGKIAWRRGIQQRKRKKVVRIKYRHVESLELLKQEIEGTFLLQGFVIPPFYQNHLGHHQLEKYIQENPDFINFINQKLFVEKKSNLIRSVSGDFQRSADCGGMRGSIGAGDTGPSPGE